MGFSKGSGAAELAWREQLEHFVAGSARSRKATHAAVDVQQQPRQLRLMADGALVLAVDAGDMPTGGVNVEHVACLGCDVAL
jgi:hypothetical protein